MCEIRSLAISLWKRLVPRQAAYWRPLSVSISLGTPNSAAARRYTSMTACAVWLRNRSIPTMNRE